LDFKQRTALHLHLLQSSLS